MDAYGQNWHLVGLRHAFELECRVHFRSKMSYHIERATKEGEQKLIKWKMNANF